MAKQQKNIKTLLEVLSCRDKIKQLLYTRTIDTPLSQSHSLLSIAFKYFYKYQSQITLMLTLHDTPESEAIDSVLMNDHHNKYMPIDIIHHISYY